MSQANHSCWSTAVSICYMFSVHCLVDVTYCDRLSSWATHPFGTSIGFTFSWSLGGSKADSWWWSILAGRCLSPGWETTPEAIRVKNKAAAVWPAPVPASAERLASSPPPLLAQAEIFQPGPLAVKELQILYDIHPNKLDGGVLICRLDKCRTTH